MTTTETAVAVYQKRIRLRKQVRRRILCLLQRRFCVAGSFIPEIKSVCFGVKSEKYADFAIFKPYFYAFPFQRDLFFYAKESCIPIAGFPLLTVIKRSQRGSVLFINEAYCVHNKNRGRNREIPLLTHV